MLVLRLLLLGVTRWRQAAFKVFDHNIDGIISKKELREAMVLVNLGTRCTDDFDEFFCHDDSSCAWTGIYVEQSLGYKEYIYVEQSLCYKEYIYVEQSLG